MQKEDSSAKAETSTSEFKYDEVKGGYQTQLSLLKYPWLQVVQTYQQRFPTNPEFPYIKNTEILQSEKEYNKKNQLVKETITRRVLIDPLFPHWLQKLSGTDSLAFVEKSIIDYEKQEMILATHNDSLSRYVSIYEDCVYRATNASTLSEYKSNTENNILFSKQSPLQHTYKEQTGYLKLHLRLFGIEHRIEKFASYIFIARAEDAIQKECQFIASFVKKQNKGS